MALWGFRIAVLYNCYRMYSNLWSDLKLEIVSIGMGCRERLFNCQALFAVDISDECWIFGGTNLVLED